MFVRYFDSNRHDVIDALLDTIEVENGTAQHLYQAVKYLLKERGIPFENIVGFGSDNCSTMIGEKSGFKKLLKGDIPSVFIMGCTFVTQWHFVLVMLSMFCPLTLRDF